MSQMVIVQRQPQLKQVILALGSPRRFAGLLDTGSSSAIRTAMMAITTSSSKRKGPLL